MPFRTILRTFALLSLGFGFGWGPLLPAAEEQSFRLSTATPAEKAAARAWGAPTEDYGNFVIVRASGARAEALRAAAGNGLAVEALDLRIGLRSFKFDPLSARPASDSRLRGAARAEAQAAGDYYLVQFHSPIRETWLKELATMGVEAIQYVPNQAYLVFANARAAADMARHPKVRWTGSYDPLFRVSTDLKWVFGGSSERTVAKDGSYDVAVFKRADRKAVLREIDALGTVLKTDTLPSGSIFDLYRVRLAPEALAQVASLRDVYAVEPYVEKTLEDERGAQVLAGNYTGQTIANLAAPGYNPLAQFGSDGTNVTVAVVDSGIEIPGPSGFYLTAANAVSAPLRGASGTSFLSGHGHFCAGIIGGSNPLAPMLDPLGYNYGRGVAPGVNLVSVPFITNTYTGSDADVANDMVVTLAPNGLRSTISNNSWGAGTGVDYQSREAAYDGFVRDASTGPSIDAMLYVFSSGNGGPGAATLTRPKAAKNVITVGSSVGLRPELPAFRSIPNTNLDYMSDYSSRGPTQDGRTKPDVSAPGQQMTSPRTTSNSDGFAAIAGDSVHVYGSGTSFAAPHVSGGAALFAGWWKANNAGVHPSPALIKAALINGSVDMNAEFSGFPSSSTAAPIPNSTEGWGRVNLSNSVNPSVPTRYIDQSVVFSALSDSYTFAGTTVSSTRPLRITLVWSDVPGAIGANPAAVNDLDLLVTVGSTTYRGNVFTAGTSTSGGSADRRNNVENVYLTGLPAGTNFSVLVVPAALNGNGVLGTAGNNQNFALVVSNANVSGCPTISITPETIPSSVSGGAVYPTQTFTATGGAAPITFAVLGTLPPGLTFSGNTLSGTVTTAGIYPFTVNATDANGCIGSRSYSITVTAPNLVRGATTVTSGNNLIEPNECNTLNIVLNNSGSVAATAVNATLTSSTPGVTIVSGTSTYATIAASGGTGTNSTPFAIGTSAAVPCLTTINFTLTVQYAEGGPVVFNFSLPVGQPGGNYSFTTGTGAALPSGATGPLAGSTADDAIVNLTVPAGFSFSVYDTVVAGGSVLRVSTNGNLQIVASGGTATEVNTALPGTAFGATTRVLQPYWDDIIMTAAASPGGGIYTNLVGTAPNRQFIVEWRGCHYDERASATQRLNFAIVFKEGSSSFEYRYLQIASVAPNANGASATVGVQSANSGTVFKQFSFAQAVITSGLVISVALEPGICSPGSGPCSTAPAFTSGAPAGPAIVGSPYQHNFTVSGSPASEFSHTGGTLPPGLFVSRSGVLSGTPTSAGTGLFENITVTASNGNLPDATQTFSLPVVTRSANYLASFGLTGGNAAPNFDFEGDGLSNQLEYAFGLNPTTASANPVQSDVRDFGGTSYLSIRFPRSTLATDLTYIVEVAADLGATPIVWTELARSTAGAATTGVGFVGESGSGTLRTVEVRDTVAVPTGGQPKRFLRVRVQ